MMVALLLVYVQGAWAALSGCEGTVYLKFPDGWTSAFAAGGGNFDAFNESSKYSGWYEISTYRIGGTNATSEFHISKARNDYGQAGGITKTTIGANVQFTSANGFSCKDFGTTGELWIQPDFDDPTRPSISDKPPVVKYLYVLIPEDDTWKMAEPMIGDGVVGSRMSVDQEHCGWFYIRYVDDIPSSEVIIYRDYDEERNDVISVGRLDSIFAALEADTVYFVAESGAWSATYPGIAGDCGFNLISIIYDTDASLHGAFTCATSYYNGMPSAEGKYNGCPTNAPFSYPAGQPTPCVGVTQGIVADLLDPNTKKPTYNAASGCFVSAEAFNTMFQSNTQYNETYCAEMPFIRSANGRWKFDSDNYTSPGATAKGGFYPGETATVDPSMMLSDAVPAAHNKRKAEGPVFMESVLRKINTAEGVPEIDILCNGPGWNKGVDCNRSHLFADGYEWTSTNPPKAGISLLGDGWQWSVMDEEGARDEAPEGWTFYKKGTETVVNVTNTTGGYGTGNAARWASGGWVAPNTGKAAVQAYDATVFTNGQGRNQHFCFESHAKFIYKKGLRFGVRGDDDIWVFIDNKLAVDIGGMHLPAPGYVDLDYFVGASGGFVVGNEYDLDIFFCDRRTTSSNMQISTNMYIVQPDLGVSVVEGSKDDSGYVSLDVCHVAGGCAARALGSSKQCGENISGDVNYSIVDSLKGVVSDCEDCAALPTGKIVLGGIDLTNPKAPKILPDSIAGLRPGNYFIAVTVGEDTGYYQFSVVGDTSVAPVLMFAQPEMDSLGNIVSWTELRADPDTTEEGSEYFHWVGDTLEMYLVVMYPQTDSLCKDCDYQLDFLDKSEGISGSVSVLENGVAKVVFYSDSEYVKKSASITVGYDTLVSAAYGNMHFHVAKTDEPEDDPKDEPKEEPKEDPKEDPEDEPKDELKDEPKDDPKDEPAKDSVDTRANFSIRMVGPFQFAIVMDDENVNVHKAFAVMDVQGHVLYQGTLASREVVVPTLNAGSYIVKVGIGFRRVNVR